MPTGTVSAATARTWARRARRLGARLAFVERERPALFYASRHPRPARWGGFGNFPGGLVTDGPGRVDAPVTIARTGRYRVWLEGSFARRVTVSIDTRPIGYTPFALDNPGAYALLGTVSLERGKRGVWLTQGGGDLRPSNGGYRSSLRHIGPLVFDPVGNDADRVVELEPADWRRLVGRRADWLEIVK